MTVMWINKVVLAEVQREGQNYARVITAKPYQVVKLLKVYRHLPIVRTTTWQRTSVTLFPINATVT